MVVRPLHFDKNEGYMCVTFERGLMSNVDSPEQPDKNDSRTTVTFDNGLRSSDDNPLHLSRKFVDTAVTLWKGERLIVGRLEHLMEALLSFPNMRSLLSSTHCIPQGNL